MGGDFLAKFAEFVPDFEIGDGFQKSVRGKLCALCVSVALWVRANGQRAIRVLR